MKRTPLKRGNSQLKRSPLRIKGHSTTSEIKGEIQALVREIVILRDRGCILRKMRGCGGEIGEAVLQADHLITRSNSATYADTRLIVCLCRACHGGFKKWHKEEYDALVKSILPKDRVDLWDKSQADAWRPTPARSYDWKLAKIALEQELERIREAR